MTTVSTSQGRGLSFGSHWNRLPSQSCTRGVSGSPPVLVLRTLGHVQDSGVHSKEADSGARKQTPSHPQDSENEAVFYWKGGFCHHGVPSRTVLNSLRLRGMDRSYAPYVQWLHSAVYFSVCFLYFSYLLLHFKTLSAATHPCCPSVCF